jgi:hypothetical protein
VGPVKSSYYAEIDALKVTELKERLREMGKPVSGTKAVLQERLKVSRRSAKYARSPVAHRLACGGALTGGPPRHAGAHVSRGAGGAKSGCGRGGGSRGLTRGGSRVLVGESEKRPGAEMGRKPGRVDAGDGGRLRVRAAGRGRGEGWWPVKPSP